MCVCVWCGQCLGLAGVLCVVARAPTRRLLLALAAAQVGAAALVSVKGREEAKALGLDTTQAVLLLLLTSGSYLGAAARAPSPSWSSLPWGWKVLAAGHALGGLLAALLPCDTLRQVPALVHAGAPSSPAVLLVLRLQGVLHVVKALVLVTAGSSPKLSRAVAIG